MAQWKQLHATPHTTHDLNPIEHLWDQLRYID